MIFVTFRVHQSTISSFCLILVRNNLYSSRTRWETYDSTEVLDSRINTLTMTLRKFSRTTPVVALPGRICRQAGGVVPISNDIKKSRGRNWSVPWFQRIYVQLRGFRNDLKFLNYITSRGIHVRWTPPLSKFSADSLNMYWKVITRVA
jgi:hypothetical protein